MECPKKEREGNFSRQDCLLLVNLMGEKSHHDSNMSNHQLAKHRFTNGITSSTKKHLWKKIEASFHASAAVQRTAEKLEKKWFNLISKHRLLYSDYIRDRALTGGGSCSKTLEFLTECVMDVIGKESVAVTGAASASMDTTFNLLKNVNYSDHTELLNDIQVEDILHTGDSLETDSSRKNCCCNCHSLQDMSVEDLKKRKLVLQIQYFEKKLKK